MKRREKREKDMEREWTDRQTETNIERDSVRDGGRDRQTERNDGDRRRDLGRGNERNMTFTILWALLRTYTSHPRRCG